MQAFTGYTESSGSILTTYWFQKYVLTEILRSVPIMVRTSNGDRWGGGIYGVTGGRTEGGNLETGICSEERPPLLKIEGRQMRLK
jgi:hypothetical protein